MNKNGPVLLVDDDKDDRELFEMAYSKLDIPNPIISYENAQELLENLKSPDLQPFLIICDINMPGMNGLQLRDTIFGDRDLREKAIPFLFFTTSTDRATVKEAYHSPVQGIFSKPASLEDLQKRISRMIDYWRDSLLL